MDKMLIHDSYTRAWDEYNNDFLIQHVDQDKAIQDFMKRRIYPKQGKCKAVLTWLMKKITTGIC